MNKADFLMLRASAIAGVGVHTDCEFLPGEMIPVWHEGDYRQIVKPEGRELVMCGIYCIKEGDVWHCPASFTRMSVGWYLNHSDTPNAEMREDILYALRRIEAGEEITIDYGGVTYEDQDAFE